MIYFNCPRIMEEKKILKRAEMTCKIIKEDGQEKMSVGARLSKKLMFNTEFNKFFLPKCCF